MVRRKIEIKRIEDKAKRYTTFSKRRQGLVKKFMEFCSKIDGAEGAVLAFSKAGNAWGFAHPHINNVLTRYYADRDSSASQEKEDDDVVNEENCSSSLDQLTEETQKMVSEAMKTKTVESALKNVVEFAELDGLDKVFSSILADTVARRRQAELNEKDGHAD